MPANDQRATHPSEPGEEHRTLFMRDLVDGQLSSLDGRRLGRVADVEAEWLPDGSMHLRRLVLGPEAHLWRISHRLRGLGQRLLGGRHDHRIEMSEVEEIGPSVMLRGRAEDYDLGGLDRWIVDRLFRFIPGSGR